MNHATIPRDHTTGEAIRLSPLEAFVAWLTTFLRTIAGLKRRTVFPTNWKDHWEGLRELEWYRDQILAFSAKHVLAGGSLDDRTDFQLITEVPADYGVCPQTPQAMNRRFIAMAQFRLDPDKYIQRHIHRIATRAGIKLDHALRIDPLRHATKTSRASTQCVDPAGFAGGGKRSCPTQAPLAPLSRHATGGGGMRVLHAHDGGGLAFCARAPPNSLSANANPPRWLRQRGRTHLFRSAPNPGNAKVSPLTGRITYVV